MVLGTYLTFFVLVIVSVTLIVVLTRSSTPPSPVPTVTPTPSATPAPPIVRNVRLKDVQGLCYQFSNLQPQLSSPEVCTGFWIENTTAALGSSLTYDGGLYETCVQPPPRGVSGGFVLGTIGAGCNGVTLQDTVVLDQNSGLCVINTNGVLTWGNCDSAYHFVVEAIT